MRVAIIAAVLALTSCVTTPIGYPKARASIDRVEAAFTRVRGPAELAIARLPEPARSRARAALLLADAALAVVRGDATPLERAAAARELVRQAAVLAGYRSSTRKP